MVSSLRLDVDARRRKALVLGFRVFLLCLSRYGVFGGFKAFDVKGLGVRSSALGLFRLWYEALAVQGLAFGLWRTGCEV